MSRQCDLNKLSTASDPRVKQAVETNTHDEITYVKIERLQLESSSSPLSSSVKMDPPIRTSGNVRPDPRIQQERPPSPTHSYVSTRTNRSMDEPVKFMEGFACKPRSFYGVQVERPGSPESTCMSVRSDWSKDEPLNFKGVFSPDKSGMWPGGEDCDFCTERKLGAVKSCLNCTASYCEMHLRQHSSVPVRQRHTLVEATGNLEHRLCPQHHRALELFCNTDQMPICSLCPALTHRGHDVVCSEPGTQNDFYTKRVDEWIVQHHPTQASAGVPPPPGEIAFPTVGSDSVCLSWGSPEGMDTESVRFRVTCISDTKQRSFNVTGINHINIQSLSPGKEYTFTVVTIGDKGTQSRSISATVSTVIPAPVGLTIDSVTTTSFSLCWREPRGLDQTPSFLVSNCSPGAEPQFISTELHSTVLSNLQPGRQSTVSVCTVLENGEQSEAVSRTLYTEPSPPESLRAEEVRSRSVRLCWDKPVKMEGVSYTFSIIYTCDGEKPKELTTESNINTADLCDLKPGMEYSFSICTVLHNGTRSRACLIQAHTEPSAPGELKMSSLCETSLRLSWDRPTYMEGVPHTFRVTWGDSTGQGESVTTDENPTVLSYLRPGTEYSISVCTVLQSTGLESESVHTTVCTKPSPPGKLNISSVCETSLCLSWDRPTDMERVPHTFRVTWGDSTGQRESITTDESHKVLSYLTPGTEYSISVCTVVQSTGLESEPVHTTICTKPSPPESFNICHMSVTSVCLSWDRPPYMEGVTYTFRVTWGEFREQSESITTDENFTVLSHLRPVTEYSISVCTLLQSTGLESEPVHTIICTNPSPPEKLRVEEVRSRSVRLHWDTPASFITTSGAGSVQHEHTHESRE
ncbi:hypothetical protein AGOR_G00189070 [Albula goreensis]|uniref:Fibronectin-like n=1 Tax=Albula goreensis TaxID=1534307 RepID=A0A8T3CY36_9TELE|nr:hypothetical protein AGOR_G00189070 [Albula goreensis]